MSDSSIAVSAEELTTELNTTTTHSFQSSATHPMSNEPSTRPPDEPLSLAPTLPEPMTKPIKQPDSRLPRLQHRISSLESQIQTTQAELTTALSALQSLLQSPTTTTTTTTSVDSNTDPTNSTREPPAPSANPNPTPTHLTFLPPNHLQTQSQAESIVRKHIRLIKTYNEIKDIGMGLMGFIAERDGKRMCEVMAQFDVNEKD